MSTELVVLEYIKVLAWPLTVVVAAVVFRADLRLLITRMTRVEAMGASAEFERAISQAGASTRPVGSVTPPPAATIHATNYNDARKIGEAYRDGKGPVQVDLSLADQEEAKRLVDFMAGTIFNAQGVIERVTSKSFILWPPRFGQTSKP